MIDVVDKDDNRIKNIADVLHDGYIYLSIKYVSKNENEEENGSFVLTHPTNTFVRVKYIGDDFLYLDIPLKTMGNFIASTALVMGGIIGAAVSTAISINTPRDYRPVIMYNDTKDFRIFKNCKDFNEHFEERNPNMKINCDADYNLNNIRKKIITEL